MRWLWGLVFVSSVAHASSVLLVPADDRSRPAAEAMVDTVAGEKRVAKMAPPGSPAVQCLATPATRDACLADMEDKAKVSGILVVSAVMKGAKGVVTVELFASGATVKKEVTKVAKAKLKRDLKKPTLALLRSIPDAPVAVEAPEPAPVVVVADAPRKEDPVLTPEPEVKPAAVDVTQPTPVAEKPKVAAWVMTGVTAAALGVGATFGALGMTKRAQLERAPDGVSPYSYSEALALQQEANRDITIATGVGIGAGVSFVITAILWGVE